MDYETFKQEMTEDLKPADFEELANLRSNNDCGFCAPLFMSEKKDAGQ